MSNEHSPWVGKLFAESMSKSMVKPRDNLAAIKVHVHFEWLAEGRTISKNTVRVSCTVGRFLNNGARAFRLRWQASGAEVPSVMVALGDQGDSGWMCQNAESHSTLVPCVYSLSSHVKMRYRLTLEEMCVCRRRRLSQECAPVD